MASNHQLLRRCLAYVIIIAVGLSGTALGLAGAGFVLITTAKVGTQPESSRQPSWLHQKIEDGREIRRALAERQPAKIAPLPPVTNKRTPIVKVAAIAQPQTINSRQARVRGYAAFSKMDLPLPAYSYGAYAPVDRHGPAN
jgi:hypothetical protein